MYNIKLNRVLQKVFGWEADDTQVVEFGSPTNGRAVYSKSAADIQTSYYEAGWFPESLSGNIRPYAEDMNGLHYVHSYQLAYLLQAGIPEWNEETPYFGDCIVRVGRVLYAAIPHYINEEDPTQGETPNKGNNPTASEGEGWWEVYVLGDPAVPVGASLEWNGRNLPANGKWMFENGEFLNPEIYTDLFAVLDYTFGFQNRIVDQGTPLERTVKFFALPNSTGKVAIGFQSGTVGLDLGNTGGQFNHEHFVPAHYHGKGNLEITQSGQHSHGLSDAGHFHSLASHQHKFRFGDFSAASGSGIERLSSLGSTGTGSNNNPPRVGWDTGPGGKGKGHFMKMTSPNISAGSQDATPDSLKKTGDAMSNISCNSAQHSHSNGTFSGRVGSLAEDAPSGDTGTMLTRSSNSDNFSSNMPFIVKRKIIRVLP